MEGLQRWASDQANCGGVSSPYPQRRRGRSAGGAERLEWPIGLRGHDALLDRNQNGITLYVRGRDVEEKESALNFTAGYWSVIGDATEVRRSDERSVIAEFLADNPEPITPTELAAALGWKINNTKQLLYKMAKAGQVVRSKGHYSVTPITPVTLITQLRNRRRPRHWVIAVIRGYRRAIP